MHTSHTSLISHNSRVAARRTVLVVEDEQSIRDILVELFEVDGNLITAVADLPSALALLRTRRFDLVVTDLRLGGKRDGGLQVMALAGMLSPDATVLVLTAYPDDANRQASFRLGALHFLEKPVDLATIAMHAHAAGVATAFANETARPVATVDTFPSLSAMRDQPRDRTGDPTGIEQLM